MDLKIFLIRFHSILISNRGYLWGGNEYKNSNIFIEFNLIIVKYISEIFSGNYYIVIRFHNRYVIDVSNSDNCQRWILSIGLLDNENFYNTALKNMPPWLERMNSTREYHVFLLKDRVERHTSYLECRSRNRKADFAINWSAGSNHTFSD
jgi:hypothetical protein